MTLNVAQIAITAKDETGSAFSSVTSGIDTLRGKFAALTGALGISAFAALMKASLDSAEHMNRLSQSTGISVESLSKLSVASKFSGVDIDAMALAMQRLSRNAMEAASGTGISAAAFRAMGISVLDSTGHLKNADSLMGEISDRFAEMEDGAGKTALAIALFGRNGAELIPMLNRGSEDLAKWSDLAERLGLVMSSGTAKGAEEVNDRFTIMGLAVKGIANRVLTEMLPTFDMLSKSMVDAATDEEALKVASDTLSMGLKGLAVTALGAGAGIFQFGQLLGGGAAAISRLAQGDLKGALYIVQNLKKDMQATGDDFLKRMNSILTGTAKLDQKMDVIRKKKPAPLFSTGTAAQAPHAFESNLLELDRMLARRLNVYDELRLKAEQIATAEGKMGRLPEAYAKIESIHQVTDQKLMEKYLDRLSEENDALDFQGSIMLEDARDQEVLTKERERYQAVEKAILDAELAGYPLTMENQERLRQKVAQSTEAMVESIRARQEMERSWQYGTVKAAQAYVDEVTNAAKASSSIFTNAFRTMEDAMVEFVKKGKIDFRSLADSILSDLLRIQMRQMVLAPLSQMLSGSSFFSNLGEMLGFSSYTPYFEAAGYGGGIAFGGGLASGGFAAPDTLYRVNERGPEVFSSGGRDYLMTGSSRGEVKPLGHVVNISVNVEGSATKATADQIARTVGAHVARAIRRNG